MVSIASTAVGSLTFTISDSAGNSYTSLGKLTDVWLFGCATNTSSVTWIQINTTAALSYSFSCATYTGVTGFNSGNTNTATGNTSVALGISALTGGNSGGGGVQLLEQLAARHGRGIAGQRQGGCKRDCLCLRQRDCGLHQRLTVTAAHCNQSGSTIYGFGIEMRTPSANRARKIYTWG